MKKLVEPAAVSDETRRHSLTGLSVAAPESASEVLPPVVHPFSVEDESKAKVKVKEYVSRQPEQAALVAMAAGAALTGFFRYLSRRRESRHPQRLTRSEK